MEDFETAILANGKTDYKGRYICFIVTLYRRGDVFKARVQNGRVENPNRISEYKPFGATQRAKEFKTLKDAKTWAYKTAHARVRKLNK